MSHSLRQYNHIEAAAKKFINYVGAKQVHQLRFRDSDYLKPVYIPKIEIEQSYFPYQYFNAKEILERLVEDGRLKITTERTPAGHQKFLYDVGEGEYDLSVLLPRKMKVYYGLHKYMREQLSQISLAGCTSPTPWFDVFKKYYHDLPELFFTVDSFSGRVHTPVCSLKSEQRQHLLIDGVEVVRIDLNTAQPLCLSKILKEKLGDNEFTNWVESGLDVYEIFKQRLSLQSRDEAKVKLFELMFAYPSERHLKLYGDEKWIRWMNEFKKTRIDENPHHEKPHTNVAWLLQKTEVEAMTKVWQSLMENSINFLTVHDEIIVPAHQRQQTFDIMKTQLKKSFSHFKLTIHD